MAIDPAAWAIPYSRQTLDDEDVAAVIEALRSPLITTGPRVEAFERALCEATGARHAVAVSSGTAALHLAYAACGLGEGDEVITTPNTFVATASAAVFCGARPVFVDIEREQQNIDPDRVDSRVTARTRAIVAVDFAGHPAAFDALREISDRRGLRLIADASHSLGASWRGRRVGTLADLTCLSFHPVKAITTGEGGAVLTDDDELARACRLGRNHGMERDRERVAQWHGPWFYEVQTLGWNYRISDLQCALGSSQLAKLARHVDRRAQLARRYADLLGDVADLRRPREAPDVRSAWHLYVVETPAERRGEVFETLRARGVGVQVHYVPVYRHPYYRRLLGIEPSTFARCEEYYARALSIPLYPALSEADQDRVAEELKRAIVDRNT